MPLTVVSVAYPLAPVSPDAVGGAEQVLSLLDRALAEAGHVSIVIAQAGSRVAGTLVPIPVSYASRGRLGSQAKLDDAAKAAAQGEVRRLLEGVIAGRAVDVVHLHGIDFAAYLPPPGAPVLATLHLPLGWYGADALAPARPRTWLHGVSASQTEAAPSSVRLLPPIPNGVDLAAFAAPHAKRRFALMLGRICPEKGVHLGMEAARRVEMPLLIGGQVFPYPEHERYFADEVAPRLDAECRFLGPLGLVRKRRLLGAARCLLVPSLAPETSSLVAREALAAGTPVVALANGALSEVVEHGRTGFLAEDVDGLAQGILSSSSLDPASCRQAARDRFSAGPMIAAYLALYARLASERPPC